MHWFKQGHLFILGAAILFGTAGTARAFAPEGMGPAFIGALRLAIGGPTLLAFAAVTHRQHSLIAGLPLGVTLLAVAGVCLFQVCFFAAIIRTGVAVGTLVAIGSAPVAAGLLEAIIYKEPITPRWVVAACLSIGGCSLLVTAGNEITLDRGGILLAAGAGFGYAVYQVASKRLVKERSPVKVMAVVLCAGAILLAPCLATAEVYLLASLRGLAIALFLGVAATAVAYALFTRGLITVPVSRAAVLGLMEPLTASVLGVFILGEYLTAPAWIGAALIVCGLCVVVQPQDTAVAA